MSKKKSLGSSPIGLKSEDSSMGFIPDIGVSESRKKINKSSHISGEERKSETKLRPVKKKKKIVSYNLEVDLIKKIKSQAKQKEMYYSSFISMVLRNWLAENNEH